MDDPKRNIPRAIVVVMLLVSAFYFLIMTVSIVSAKSPGV